jgi:hypothetical protein
VGGALAAERAAVLNAVADAMEANLEQPAIAESWATSRRPSTTSRSFIRDVIQRTAERAAGPLTTFNTPAGLRALPKLTGGAVLDHLAAVRGGVDRRVREQLAGRQKLGLVQARCS